MTTEAAPTTEEQAPDMEAPSELPGTTDWQAEAEKWKAMARKHEATSKANAEAAEKIQALEDAQKSETERLTDKATRAEAKAQALEIENARLTVALEKGLSADQMEFLSGDSVEELREKADRLLALIAPEEEQEEEQEELAPTGTPAPATPRPRLKTGSASYGIGNDDALLRDLKRKVGIK